jgi:hypothetical protein
MNETGFFGTLFDLSFSRFIASKLIKFVYVLAIIAGVIVVVVAVVSGFGSGQPVQGIIALIVGPFAFFAYLILIRLYCEFFIVVFAIAEDLNDIRRGIQRLAGPPAPPPSG